MSTAVKLVFSSDARARLDTMKKKSQADSDAEVIRCALRIYEWHIAQKEAGYKIGLVRDEILEKTIDFFEPTGTPVIQVES